MDNPITNWSFDKPEKEGKYLACYGDVETDYSTSLIEVWFDSDGILRDQDGKDINAYSDTYKFARLVYLASELAELNDE